MRILRKLFEILLFLSLIIYSSGGIVIAGKTYLGYVTDFLNALAAMGIIAVISGASLADAKLIRGFAELTEERTKSLSMWGKFAITLICYWVTLFFIDPIIDHRAHLTGLFDLGLMEQIIWRNANDLGPTSTILGSALKPLNYILNNHLNLWLYPISWVYKIFPKTETLIVLKSLAILLCVIPLWKIARVLWGEKVPAILLPLFFWLWDCIHRVNIWHFHETPFMPFFGLWAYYFFIRGKWGFTVLFTLLMALFKEDAWITAGAMGFYFLAYRRRWGWAVASLVLGFAVFLGYSALCQKVLSIQERYAYLGSNLKESIGIVTAHPSILLQQLFKPESRPLIESILIVGGGVWLLSGIAIIPVLPYLLECALSTHQDMLRPQSHHIFGIGAPLLFAVAIGLRNVLTWTSKWNWQPQTVLSIIVLIAATGLGFGEASGIRRVLLSSDWQNRDCLNQLVRNVPTNAPIYVDPKYGSLLAGRAILLGPPSPSLNEKTWKDIVPEAWALLNEAATLPKKVSFIEKRCGATLLKL